jgi:diguanylate cyclase (GGDEF)-like protein
LTGLVNRREFERKLAMLLDSGKIKDKQHVLLYLDLDQFKVVNDTCGHIAGDELLRQLTALLSDKVRDNDTLARLGGDEFGVLLEACPVEQGMRIAEEMRKTIAGFKFAWENKLFDVGVSIGLVPLDAQSESMAAVLSAADAACYAAKDDGRNRVQIFHGDKESGRRQGEMQWVSHINKALEENRFVLFFQEIKPVASSGHGRHFEILVRMRDEQGALVPPMAFIPAAERYNLMLAIDKWVVCNTFDWLVARGFKDGDAMSCAINLSGQSFGDDAFLEFMLQQFDTRPIPQGSVCFEITETAAIANLNKARRFISSLREKGCRFALDDFGSGMSSYAYLKNLEVDYLKIDGVFVKDMVNDAVDYAMVESINRIGHVMGLKTIAEFVESDAILEKLREMGVDYAQGYGIHKPEPLQNYV